MASSFRMLSPTSRAMIALVFLALTSILAPAYLIRIHEGVLDAQTAYLGQFIGICGAVGVLITVNWMYQSVRRHSAHKIVSTYISPGAGLIIVAVQCLAYGVLTAMGLQLVYSCIEQIVSLGMWKNAIYALVLLTVTLALVGSDKIKRHVLVSAAGCAIAFTFFILGAGLIRELTSSTLDTSQFMHVNTTWHTWVRVVALSLFPAGVIIMVSERPALENDTVRLHPRRLAKASALMLLLILITLYFEARSGWVVGAGEIPVLQLASLFLGRAGQIVGIVLFSLLGISGVTVGLWAIPRLLRALARENVLPRHIATNDATRAQIIILLVADVAIMALVSSTKEEGLALIFMWAVLMLALLVCIAMVFRAVTILRTSTDKDERSTAKKMRIIFALLSLVVACVLALITVSDVKRTLIGAGVILALTFVFLFMRRGRRAVTARLHAEELSVGRTLATRVHGVAVVQTLDLPTLRMLTYARSSRLSSLTAITVEDESANTRALQKAWKEADLPIDLTVVPSTSATVSDVVLYVRSIRSLRPGDIVMVYVTKIISTGLWQRFFIRHSTPRMITQLRMEPGVVICEVPYVIVPEEKTKRESLRSFLPHSS